jgi:hypothetical protein
LDAARRDAAEDRAVPAVDSDAVFIASTLLRVAIEVHVVREKLTRENRRLLSRSQLERRIKRDGVVVRIREKLRDAGGQVTRSLLGDKSEIPGPTVPLVM